MLQKIHLQSTDPLSNVPARSIFMAEAEKSGEKETALVKAESKEVAEKPENGLVMRTRSRIGETIGGLVGATKEIVKAPFVDIYRMAKGGLETLSVPLWGAWKFGGGLKKMIVDSTTNFAMLAWVTAKMNWDAMKDHASKINLVKNAKETVTGTVGALIGRTRQGVSTLLSSKTQYFTERLPGALNQLGRPFYSGAQPAAT